MNRRQLISKLFTGTLTSLFGVKAFGYLKEKEMIPNIVVSMPSQLFTLARKFQAASNGKIFIGKIDTDPTLPENQIQVYVEKENGGLLKATQPISINQAGFPVYNGQIAKFVTVEGHSMAVYDSYGVQQFYYPNVLKYDPDQFEKRFRDELSSDSGAEIIGSHDGNLQEVLTECKEKIQTNEHIALSANSLYPQPTMSFSNRKMAIEVINSDPLSGSGYINTYRKTKNGWWVRERIVTGGYSGGSSLPDNKCPLWRLGQLFIAPHILTIKSTASDMSNNGIANYDIIPSQFKDGNNKQPVTFYQLQGGESSEIFVEFTTNTKSNFVNILFASSKNSNKNTKIEVMFGDKVLLTENVDLSSDNEGFDTFIYQVKNPRIGKNLRVRISTTGTAWAYVAGINANFDTEVSDDIDTIKFSIYNQNYLIRPTQTGAMCYVFKELESGLFGGESHGGESPKSQRIIVDNREKSISDNTVFSCESFSILQESEIKWSESKKIYCVTEHRFNSDGTHEFIGSFTPSDNLNLSIGYCPMFTVNSQYFRRIKSPEYINIDDKNNGEFIDIRYPINNFEIQGADGLYTSGISWSSSLKNNGIQRVFINPYGDSSTKMYAGPAIDRTITAEKFTIHQMRYYF